MRFPPKPRKFPPASAAVAWTVLVLVILFVPVDLTPDDQDEEPSPGYLDKGTHLVLFYFESFFVLRWLASRQPSERTGARQLVTAAFLASCLAVATETVQRWVPERSSNPADLAANLLGIALHAGPAGGRIRRRAPEEDQEDRNEGDRTSRRGPTAADQL